LFTLATERGAQDGHHNGYLFLVDAYGSFVPDEGQLMEKQYFTTALKWGPKMVYRAMAALGRKVCALLPTTAAMAGPPVVSPQGVKMEALAPPTAGVGTLGPAWKQSILLGLLVYIVYSANGREIPIGDSFPARLLAVAFIRGDGPFLDRFSQFLPRPDPGVPQSYYMSRERGHLVSNYPLGTAVLAIPFYLPQVLVLDWLRPGWEDTKEKVARYTSRMAKNTAAAFGALTAVAIFHLLRRLGLGRLAWPTALSTALASNLWCDSQTLWPHVPAALALTLLLILLVPVPVSRPRLCLAGLTTAALVWIRPQDLLLALVIFLWVARYQFRDLVWFVPLPLLLGAALAGYNYWFFGALAGGYGKLETGESYSLQLTSLLTGLAGNLWSPGRGLFLYCPWLAVALVTIPPAVTELRSRSIICWLLGVLVPYVLLYSVNTLWYGGLYFGPRYFTDVIPLFAILLGFGLTWSWTRFPPVFVAFVVTIVLATEVQLVGAFCYPSTWGTSFAEEGSPPARAWDWYDNELSRCLTERTKTWKRWQWWLEFFALDDRFPPATGAVIYVPGTRIDFTKAFFDAYLVSGWHELEPDYRWSLNRATVRFKLEAVQPLRLRMMAGTLGRQRIVLGFNGQQVATVQGSGEGLELFEVDLPPGAIAETNTLELTLPDAQSPQSIGLNEDNRILGVGVAWMEFEPLSENN
jgi:hypothetical protein